MSTVETAVGRFVWHDHISKDPAAASGFYADLLGWEIEVWKPGEMDYPMIKVHEESHGKLRPGAGRGAAALARPRAVDDVDAAAGRAEGAGGASSPRRSTSPRSAAWPSSPTRRAPHSRSSPPSRGVRPTGGVFVWDELMTTDVEDAKRFYGEVVGWESRDQDMGEFTYTLFTSGGADRAGGA